MDSWDWVWLTARKMRFVSAAEMAEVANLVSKTRTCSKTRQELNDEILLLPAVSPVLSFNHSFRDRHLQNHVIGSIGRKIPIASSHSV